MAAIVTSSVWSKPGAWALDSEQHEADELTHEETHTNNHHSKGGDTADFPSLAAAAATKTKKKKPQSMSVAEFLKPSQPKTLTTEDLMMLPTGPRERTAEELDRSRLGGGFKSYGYDRNNRNNDESSNSRWGSSRVSDEPRRQSREIAPSRADEVDDWGATKKSGSGNGFERRERGFFGSESRADDSDSWVSNKSFVPSEGRRFESMRERRVGFESNGGADSENWVKKKEEEGRKTGAFDSLRDRRGGFESNGGSDSENWGKKREEGGGSGSGRPRLNLQPRTLPVAVGEGQQNGTGVKAKGSNPFGEARPREEILKEKGKDWKEIDEKLESMKIKELGSGNDGKRSFGSGNGRVSTPEGRNERSWRKLDSAADVGLPSADKVESGLAKEAEDGQE